MHSVGIDLGKTTFALRAFGIVAAIGNGAAFRKGETSLHGWGSCKPEPEAAVRFV